MIDFLEEHLDGCPNFTWMEALYLPQWNVCAVPSHDVIKRIASFAPKVQAVREYLNMSMLVECWWRPVRYNKLVGGAIESEHLEGGALDFKVPGKSGDAIRKLLQPKLEEFELRMEDLPGASWVHIDDKKTTGKRFFRP